MQYTLSEFRSNLRDAFNKAENGEDVTIKRYKTVFSLMAGQLPGNRQSATRGTAEKRPAIAKASKVQLCEHYQPKGSCLIRGCKYS